MGFGRLGLVVDEVVLRVSFVWDRVGLGALGMFALKKCVSMITDGLCGGDDSFAERSLRLRLLIFTGYVSLQQYEIQKHPQDHEIEYLLSLAIDDVRRQLVRAPIVPSPVGRS